MYIKRTIKGTEYKFPLTTSELIEAYLVQRRLNRRDDVVNHIDDYDEIKELSPVELNKATENITDRYEKYLDNNDEWATHLNNAFKDVIEEGL